MKLSTRALSASSAALLSLTLLVGCGAKEDTAASSSASSSSSTAASASAAETSAAASESAAPAKEAVIPEGYKVVTAANNGISFAIPADWVEMKAADVAGAVEGSAVLDEAAAQAGIDPTALLAVVESSDLMAFSSDISSGFSNNVNVMAEPVYAESLPTEADMVSVIESVSGTPAGYETLETPLGESAIMGYNMEMQGTTMHAAYLVLPAGSGEGFTMLTVSTLDAAETDKLVREIAASATKAQ